ncbi:hypothetical protein AHAS_Ahas02G0183600 [Arachis hypogaea]
MEPRQYQHFQEPSPPYYQDEPPPMYTNFQPQDEFYFPRPSSMEEYPFPSIQEKYDPIYVSNLEQESKDRLKEAMDQLQATVRQKLDAWDSCHKQSMSKDDCGRATEEGGMNGFVGFQVENNGLECAYFLCVVTLCLSLKLELTHISHWLSHLSSLLLSSPVSHQARRRSLCCQSSPSRTGSRSRPFPALVVASSRSRRSWGWSSLSSSCFGSRRQLLSCNPNRFGEFQQISRSLFQFVALLLSEARFEDSVVVVGWSVRTSKLLSSATSVLPSICSAAVDSGPSFFSLTLGLYSSLCFTAAVASLLVAASAAIPSTAMSLLSTLFVPSAIVISASFSGVTPCSSFTTCLLHPPSLSKPSFLIQPSNIPTTSLSLSASSSSYDAPISTPTPIFLPYLQQQEEDVEAIEIIHEEQKEAQEEEQPCDPIYKFFKERTLVPSQDPLTQGKLTLQKNRRISWHLAVDTALDSDEQQEEEIEMGLDQVPFSIEEEEGEDNKIEWKKELPQGIVGEIVHLARNLPENLTLEEALDKGFEGRVSEEDCWEVLEVLEEEKLILCCLYFFQWMRSQEPSLVTPRSCTVLFPALGRARMGDKLMVLFRNLPSTTEFKDVHVYNAAISGLLDGGRYEDAWKVYEVMETENIRPDHVTCSIMIVLMRKLGHSAKDAWQFFEKMNRKGVQWSEEVLGALIKSFCVEGLVNEALIIQIEMEKKGISPNAIVYNTLMDAYCKSNHVEEAEGLFVEMKSKGIKPTEATFNILMHAYSRRMQPKIVEKLLEEMQDVGLKPNVKSYTCVISAYGKQKKMCDMASDAFLKMKKVGIQPTSHSYTALIHAYSISGWHEKAYAAYESMQREGIKPSIETYTALLDAFRRAGDTQTLMKIWKLMMLDKIEGTRVTFNILVDGFAKQGRYMEARDVISEFGKMGLHPTVMTYNMLMNAYARGGRHSKLPQLLKEMENLNLKPDSVTYSTMIYAYVRVRDFKRAFFYHKQMVKTRQVPDLASYQKLRSILDVKAAKKNRKDRSALVGIINSKMGITKVKRQKDEFWKHRKKHVTKRSADASAQ